MTRDMHGEATPRSRRRAATARSRRRPFICPFPPRWPTLALHSPSRTHTCAAPPSSSATPHHQAPHHPAQPRPFHREPQPSPYSCAPPTHPSTSHTSASMEISADECCWICLAGAEAGELERPCQCPRLSHRECSARWRLTRAGRRYAGRSTQPSCQAWQGSHRSLLGSAHTAGPRRAAPPAHENAPLPCVLRHSEESSCRFCKARLPPLEEALAPPHLVPTVSSVRPCARKRPAVSAAARPSRA